MSKSNEEIKELKLKIKSLKSKIKEKDEEIKELKKQLKSPINNIIIGDEFINASSIDSLNKELKNTLKKQSFTKQDLRFIVDRFYDIQTRRIELSNQIYAKENIDNDTTKCNELLDWELSIYTVLEKGYNKAMEIASSSTRSGRWLRSIKGIGPALAATLEAYLDIDKASHANSFIQYAGLNDHNKPWLGKIKSEKLVEEVINNLTQTQVEYVCSRLYLDLDFTISKITDKNGNMSRALLFNLLDNNDKKNIIDIVGSNSKITYEQLELISIKSKWKISYLESKSGEVDKNGNYSNLYDKDKVVSAISIIPYNKKLKVAVWKIGEQLVKVCNSKDSLYGRLYKERKIYEMEKNEKGDYADQAKRILDTINIKNKDVLQVNSEGKLTKGHIESRAKRYAVTLLLNHYFEACYYYEYGKKPPVPYAIAHLGHVDYIEPEVAFDSIE